MYIESKEQPSSVMHSQSRP